ncbi:UNVERIFIED_CONTAM: Subtilisin-like protease SBT5.6 [Sesamum radiatum]|uniref:Subtilisin-like protease SBT5.6 n=1 Tax=Sesamum radiatum TaxID=300843 RepID=A0AAW2KI01_SESRA
MKDPSVALLLLFFLVNLHLSVSLAKRQVYIVHIGDQSAGRTLVEIEDNHFSYLTSVKNSEEEAKASLLYSYKNIINGFSALLTPDEAEKLSDMDGVVSVIKSEPISYRTQTTRSWEFTDLLAGGNSKFINGDDDASLSNYGKDVIVGVLDSARDRDGHGTHTASTVAGREVPHTTLLGGFANGTAAGGASLARLAIYKVCWAIPGQATFYENTCAGEDMLAAFDDAIADGVHVISISIVPYQLSSYGEDLLALGAFHAAKRDIVVAASCGNSGPAPSTVRNLAPWIISVAASSIDRVFSSPVLLGNGMKIEGESVTPHKLSMMHPLIYAGDAEIPGTTNNETSGLCLQGTLSKELVQGKIVLCLRGYSTNVEKGLEVRGAGGLGFILQNPVDGISISVDAHVLPGTAVLSNDSATILNYIKSNKNPTASILSARTVLGSKPSPFMAGFSSAGPNPLEPNILKPDITAPGLNILAAWSEATSPTKFFDDSRVVKYNILSGTSMSCPHVAAAAVLIKATHPNWSSAAIRSALMTTATQTNKLGLPITDGTGDTAATPFHYGSGHFRPGKALDPGLIYDANYTDYLLYLCNYNTSVPSIDPSFTCPDDFPSPTDLNYPSIAVSNVNSSGISVRRTVTNVGGGATVYKVRVEAPVGYTVEISPETMNFSSVGQRESFNIVIRPGSGLRNGYAFGWYTWSDGIHSVRSPIVVSSH